MSSTCLTCTDYVFTKNPDGVSGAGIPVKNLLMESELAPMCVDNTQSAPVDERVSSLFKGEIGVPLGLVVIGPQKKPDFKLNESIVGVAPPRLMDQLVELLQPRSASRTRKRRPSRSVSRRSTRRR